MAAGKRLFDLVVGTVLCILALPIIGILAICVTFSLGCSPFFAQDRVGRGGKVFRFWKLRTLPKSTPAYADKYAIQEISTPGFTQFLRQTHLDELPQLLLVPLGRMSLVGPRPEMPQLHRAANTEFAEARTVIRPGCAGLWQAGPDQHRLIWESPEYDLFYLQHWCLRFDIWILWRTLAVMLRVGKPVALADIPLSLLGRGMGSRQPLNPRMPSAPIEELLTP